MKTNRILSGLTVNRRKLCFGLLALATISRGDTLISDVAVSGVWNAAGSPYIVATNISVSGSLTISEGVTVRFRSGTGLSVPIGMTLHVYGTDANPVLLTADSETPTLGFWVGVSLSNSNTDNVIRKCVIEYARCGVNLEAGGNSSSRYCNLALEDSVIRFCSANGISASAWGSATYIGPDGIVYLSATNCQIIANGQSGVEIDPIDDAYNEGAVYASFVHNIVRNNAVSGISVHGSGLSSLELDGCVLYSNTVCGVDFSGSGDFAGHTRNNIIGCNAIGIMGTALCNADISYNDVWGNSLDWNGFNSSWKPGELSNLNADPLFADPAGNDFHLKSMTGRWVSVGYWTNDTVHSPCIDRGHYESAWTNEPMPNAERINIGLYGNTAEASKSVPTPWLHTVVFNGGGVASGTEALTWDYVNMSNNAAVNLDYSGDGGVSWSAIAASIAVSNRVYNWDTRSLADSEQAKWRITLASNTNVSDVIDSMFWLNSSQRFYVNDLSTNNDIYCGSIGSDQNIGSAAAPKCSISGVFDAYHLKPGSTVLVDSGYYPLAETVRISPDDEGISGAFVSVVGSPSRTVIDAGTNAWSVINLASTHYLRLESLVVTNGNGIYAGSTVACRMRDVGVYSAKGYGVTLDYSSSAVLDRVTVSGTRERIISGSYSGDGNAVYGYQANYVRLIGCLVTKNDRGVYFRRGSTIRVENSTLGYNEPTVNTHSSTIQIVGYQNTIYVSNSIVVCTSRSTCEDQSTCRGDYNCLFSANGGVIGYSAGSTPIYTLVEWQAATGQDLHSLGADPLFVNVSGGDYHLQSKAGSYHGGLWTADATNSPCIDMGDPANASAAEPSWNGGFVNLGAYGNTEQASHSMDSDGDGLSDTFESWRLGSNPGLPDSDGDGARDGDEYLAGTGPTNAASVFRVGEVVKSGGEGGFTVTWLSVPGKTYRVQYADTPAGPWQEDLPQSQVTAGAGEAVKSYTDTSAGASGTRFYKVRLVLP